MIIKIPPGYTFWNAFRLAKEHFELSNDLSYVDFVFNNVNITVYRGSVYNDIATIYDLKSTIMRMENK